MLIVEGSSDARSSQGAGYGGGGGYERGTNAARDEHVSVNIIQVVYHLTGSVSETSRICSRYLL